MYQDDEKAGMVESLLGLAFCASSYPLLFESHRFIFYYGIFGCIFGFLCFVFAYLMNPQKNMVVFKMDENGIYFHNGKSHSFEWLDLEQVSVRLATDEKGYKKLMLCFTTIDKREYKFNIFEYVVNDLRTIHRLKKSVLFFSNGIVPFKHYTRWSKSHN